MVQRGLSRHIIPDNHSIWHSPGNRSGTDYRLHSAFCALDWHIAMDWAIILFHPNRSQHFRITFTSPRWFGNISQLSAVPCKNSWGLDICYILFYHTQPYKKS